MSFNVNPYKHYSNKMIRTSLLYTLRSGSNGKIEAVQTAKTTLYSKKAIVLAAGCWSGTLLRDLLREEKTVLDVPIMPRKVWIYEHTDFSLRFFMSYTDPLYFWSAIDIIIYSIDMKSQLIEPKCSLSNRIWGLGFLQSFS